MKKTSNFSEILRIHVRFAEELIKTEGDIKPLVVCQCDLITPVIIIADREETRPLIELFGVDAEWIVVIMRIWMNNTKKEECLLVQMILNSTIHRPFGDI